MSNGIMLKHINNLLIVIPRVKVKNINNILCLNSLRNVHIDISFYSYLTKTEV